MPTQQQVHVDAALTQISVDFSNNGGYIAESMFPIVNVKNASDLYFFMSKQKFRRYNTVLAPGSDFKRIDLEYDKRGYYFTDGHGLELAIPDQIRANADPAAQLDIQATRLLTDVLLVDQEYNIAQNLLSTGAQLTTLGVTYTTLSGTGQWSDFGNSDPIPVIDAAKVTVANQVGVYPNAMTISDSVFIQLRNHPKVKQNFAYTGDTQKPLSPDQLKEVLGLKYLFIGTARYNSAVEGRTDALSPLWGRNAVLFYRPDAPGLMEPAFGYTFLWTGQGFGQLIARYREQWRTQDVLQVQKYYVQQVVVPGSAYAWVNAIA
jgi:hypothetical protein